jgi:hypothetical protein
VFGHRHDVLITVFTIGDLPFLMYVVEERLIVFAIVLIEVFAACFCEHLADLIGGAPGIYRCNGEAGGVVIGRIE